MAQAFTSRSNNKKTIAVSKYATSIKAELYDFQETRFFVWKIENF